MPHGMTGRKTAFGFNLDSKVHSDFGFCRKLERVVAQEGRFGKWAVLRVLRRFLFFGGNRGKGSPENGQWPYSAE